MARSLEGNWREDVLFELQQAVDSYHFAHRQMLECDRKLEGYLASLPARMLDIPAQPEDTQAATPNKKAKKTKKPSGNQPHMDLKTELKRICGVDLTSIDGIDVMTALTIVSEIGTDMSGFKDENHFASWLGLTRQEHQRRKDHWTRKEESEKPPCRSTTHCIHHPAEERHLPVSLPRSP